MTSGLLLGAMLLCILLGLLSGFPVAFVLAGLSFIFALLGDMLGLFTLSDLTAIPNRIYGIMTNELLLAIPLFIFMGVMLERSKIAEELLSTMAELFGDLRAGLGISVIVVGALLGASTGIVGATVVTMGLISLPAMMNAKYNPQISTGIVSASGTLGQILPPSIVLILLGDQISGSYQTTQMRLGNLAPEPVSIADIFVGALIPAVVLIGLYILWTLAYAYLRPGAIPVHEKEPHADHLLKRVIRVLLPPLLLIITVLGSILGGITTATESAAIGAVGACIIAMSSKRFNRKILQEVCQETALVTTMIFTILIGATIFSLVFRGLGGDDTIHAILSDLPGGLWGALFISMLVIFVLGFFLDFIEICFVVVPIITPILLELGANPIWLAILIAMNLQTSFLTPPFGFSLFYLRGVAPKTIQTIDMYKGVLPFVIIQILMLFILCLVPSLTTWLPEKLYGTSHHYEQPVQDDISTPSFEAEDDIDF